jgi:hypothetical protein
MDAVRNVLSDGGEVTLLLLLGEKLLLPGENCMVMG